MSNPNNSGKDAAIGQFAKIGALVATFFVLPFFHRMTIGWVTDFTAQHYGYEYTSFSSIGWYIIGGFFVFVAAQLMFGQLLKLILALPKLIALLFMIGRG